MNPISSTTKPPKMPLMTIPPLTRVSVLSQSNRSFVNGTSAQYQFRLILKELTAPEGVGTNTDFVLAADTSTFLIPTVHLTGRIADGLAALLNAIYPQE